MILAGAIVLLYFSSIAGLYGATPDALPENFQDHQPLQTFCRCARLLDGIREKPDWLFLHKYSTTAEKAFATTIAHLEAGSALPYCQDRMQLGGPPATCTGVFAVDLHANVASPRHTRLSASVVTSEMCRRGWVWVTGIRLLARPSNDPWAQYALPGAIEACARDVPRFLWASRVVPLAANPSVSAGSSQLIANMFPDHYMITDKGEVVETVNTLLRSRSPKCRNAVHDVLVPVTYRLYVQNECEEFFRVAAPPVGHIGRGPHEPTSTRRTSHDDGSGASSQDAGGVASPAGEQGTCNMPRDAAASDDRTSASGCDQGLTTTLQGLDGASQGSLYRGTHEGEEEADKEGEEEADEEDWWILKTTFGFGGNHAVLVVPSQHMGQAAQERPVDDPTLARVWSWVSPDGSTCKQAAFRFKPGQRHWPWDGLWPYIAQRYVRDPLLLHGRKFNVRTFAVVASFEPLVAFFSHEASYVRRALIEYKRDDPSALDGHLSAISVGDRTAAVRAAAAAAGDATGAPAPGQSGSGGHSGLSPGSGAGSVAPPPARDSALNPFDDGHKFWWTMDKLDEYLADAQVAPRGYVNDTLIPEMKAAMTLVLRGVEERGSRPTRWETHWYHLFAFDFMLDASLQLIFLEVNSNPTITGGLSAQNIVDTLTVALDLASARREGRWPVSKSREVETDHVGRCSSTMSSSKQGQGHERPTVSTVLDLDRYPNLELLIDGDWEATNVPGCEAQKPRH
eukprot:jgi/Mesvir1/18104/Mv09401-RA.1